ncbi:MAG: Crp/Fnr family transcriptional regulator [Ginsengibacter sp.]
MEKNIKWNTAGGHSPVNAFFNSIAPISPGATNVFDQHTFPIQIKKNKLLLKPGSVADHFYFIVKGVVRGYIKEEGRQITTWIVSENEIIGSIRTLGTNTLCQEYLQALEDCELIAIPISVTEYVFDRFPETNVIARRLWEYNYRSAEERAYICRIPSATKKYDLFLKNYGHLMGRIPLKYIASFLGMTLETLSRIRSRQKNS